MWPRVVTDGPHTMKPEVGSVCCGGMHSERWCSPGLCRTCVCPSLTYRQNLLSPLKTTECHSTLQSTLSQHRSSHAWRCHGVSGSWLEAHIIWFLLQADGSQWSLMTQQVQHVPGCCLGDHCFSNNASILTCICTTRLSRTWSMGVEMFHRPLLKTATHH